VDDDELLDLLVTVEETTPLADKPRRFEELAAEVPQGEHGRTSLLVAAGEHWQMQGAYDEARRCFETARADRGESGGVPIACLFGLALELGDDDAAADELESLRAAVKRDAASPQACLMAGELLQEHGRLKEAHRWFTIPLTWAEDDGDLDFLCLTARLRVRTDLGIPRDRMDLLAQEHLEEERSRSSLDRPRAR
jgi:hypothetical protein